MKICATCHKENRATQNRVQYKRTLPERDNKLKINKIRDKATQQRYYQKNKEVIKAKSSAYYKMKKLDFTE
jgi:hypothetical protein